MKDARPNHRSVLLNLTYGMYARLLTYCERANRPRTSVIRQAINEFLRREGC